MWKASRREVFFSYYRGDRKWLDKFTNHLEPLSRETGIQLWTDTTSIRAGDRWSREIDQALGRAKVAVALVTPGYLGSKFINDRELPPLLQAANDQKLRLIWIPIEETVSDARSRFAEFQAAISPEMPLASLDATQCDKKIAEIAHIIWQTALDQIPPRQPAEPLVSKPALKRTVLSTVLAVLPTWMTTQFSSLPDDPGFGFSWFILWGFWALLLGVLAALGSAIFGRLRKAHKSSPLAAVALVALAGVSLRGQQDWPSAHFKANPAVVPGGAATTLFWRVPQGDTAFIDGLGWVPPAGSMTFLPTQSGQYHLTICDAQYHRLQDVYAPITVLPHVAAGGGPTQGPVSGAPPPISQGAPPARPYGFADILAWRLLVGNEREPDGFGLYSYLLMARGVSQELGQAVLDAINEFDPAQPFLDQGDIPYRINLLMIPVLPGKPDDVRPRSLFELYNFVRAENLIRLADCPGNGPCLITLAKPIPVNGPVPEVFILQDLSRTTPKMAKSIIEYCRNTAQLKAQGKTSRIKDWATGLRLWLAQYDTLPAGRRPRLTMVETGRATNLHQ